jgi:hypothetical protein
VNLDEVADELYGVDPGAFVATRDASASRARSEGDRGLGQAIKQLRRPSVAAWLTNLLVRESGPQLRALLEVGVAMRQAQERLAGEELRELSRRGQSAVEALVAEAATLAEALGQPASATVLGEVEATLRAALADPQAAEAVRRGRLTTSLEHSGFGSLVAVPDSARRAAPAPGASEDRSTRAAAAEARRRLDRARRSLERARDERDRGAARVADLEAQAKGLRVELTAAIQALREAETVVAKAQREAAQAERDAAPRR